MALVTDLVVINWMVVLFIFLPFDREIYSEVTPLLCCLSRYA